ncbi:hypothetical protein ACVGW6_04250, partial [Enterobacter intestinihominis]
GGRLLFFISDWGCALWVFFVPTAHPLLAGVGGCFGYPVKVDSNLRFLVVLVQTNGIARI